MENRRFQSTLPYGSDPLTQAAVNGLVISIHAPLRERLIISLAINLDILFQSTLPYGSDTSFSAVTINQFRISIHAPLRERPNMGEQNKKSQTISIHAPLRERRDEKT